MYTKNWPCAQNIPLTINFRTGIQIADKIFKGTFPYYEIQFLGSGISWINVDRNLSIPPFVGTLDEDGNMVYDPINENHLDNLWPIGGMGWVKRPSIEYGNAILYKHLGTLQILPGSSGYVSVTIWPARQDINTKVRSI
jgi:hypothetical protein